MCPPCAAFNWQKRQQTQPIHTFNVGSTFKNPPGGNNVNPSVVAIQITGRGSYVAV